MVVRLNISRASNSDNGTWICRVDVNTECVHKVVKGKLKQDCQPITRIGGKNISIVVGKLDY